MSQPKKEGISPVVNFQTERWNEFRHNLNSRAKPYLMWIWQSGFSQTQKVSNIGIIAYFVFPHLQFPSLISHYYVSDVKLDVASYKRIIFQVCRLH